MSPRRLGVAAGASLGLALVVRMTERIPVFGPEGTREARLVARLEETSFRNALLG